MLGKLFGRIYLGLTGWKTEGERPPFDKYVLVAAPHTSNWDMPIMLNVAWAMGVHVNWLGKKSLFRFPYGPLMRYLGGISVDRSKRGDLVKQVAAKFSLQDNVVLAVPPEGTRGSGKGWKSGFYYIALEAGVPIVLAYLDYKRKRGGYGPIIHPSGDIHADMDKIRAFYTSDMAKFPDQFREPRLRSEAPKS